MLTSNMLEGKPTISRITVSVTYDYRVNSLLLVFSNNKKAFINDNCGKLSSKNINLIQNIQF